MSAILQPRSILSSARSCLAKARASCCICEGGFHGRQICDPAYPSGTDCFAAQNDFVLDIGESPSLAAPGQATVLLD
jgi:hypothetical protein